MANGKSALSTWCVASLTRPVIQGGSTLESGVGAALYPSRGAFESIPLETPEMAAARREREALRGRSLRLMALVVSGGGFFFLSLARVLALTLGA